MKLYKKEINLGGKENVTLVVCNYEKETVKEVKTVVDRLHHIHVLDRSGSMCSDIDKLIDNVQSTIDMMADNDLVSVVWFSGEGQCKTILKGATKSDEIKKLLDPLRSTVGCTCFSEPLKNVNEIVSDLFLMCPNISVTFFTDGNTVTSHSMEEEEKRIFNEIDKMKEKVMSLNCIGYGSYYNSELLEKMSGSTMFGRLIHSNEIDDYSDIFSHNYKIYSHMIMEKVVVEALGDIVYLSSRTSKMSHGKMELQFLDKTKNQFAFVLEEGIDFITINDEVIDINEITRTVSKPTLLNFYYTYAYELAYSGLTDKAIDILAKVVKDKNGVDTILNAFTSSERQDALNKLEDMIFVNKNRMRSGRCKGGYIPEDDALCVMDLLQVLVTGDNYYVPVKNYNRIGLKVTDNFNLFQQDNTEIQAPFNDFVFNSKHLNLSIRYMATGKVKINPIQAAKVGLPEVVDSKIYRNQTIIKDGLLNITKFNAYIDNNTMVKLKELGFLKISKLINVIRYEDDQSCYVEVDLSKLPIINRMYAKNDDIDSVLQLTLEVERLKAIQKVINNKIKNSEPSSDEINTDRKFKADKLNKTVGEITELQESVLEEHGLNKKFDYVGVKNVKTEKNENDFYESRLLEFKLKGWSSLPSISAVEKKIEEGKELNEVEKVIEDTIKAIKWHSRENLFRGLDFVKNSINERMVKLNTLKIAKVLTGSWWTGLEVNSKGDYTYTNAFGTLKIKNDRVKIYY